MTNLSKKRILLTGGNGFIGREVHRILTEERNVPKKNIVIPDSKKDDLRLYKNALRIMKKQKTQVVIHLAAIIGGVGFSSKFPATQYYSNILMDLQVVEAARAAGVERVILVSSSCAYPKETSYPMVEEHLWDGYPQETNLAYGIAKRLMTVQADAYRQEHGMDIAVVIPNNAYGPGDNFHPEHSHVIPSLIRRCLAGENPLVVWGDGTPTRDFLYVKDFAEGVVLAAEKLRGKECINLGSGVETSVKELVSTIQRLTGHTGKILYDSSKPSGQPRRSVSIQKAKKLIGFKPRYSLKKGLKETILWYKNQLASGRSIRGLTHRSRRKTRAHT